MFCLMWMIQKQKVRCAFNVSICSHRDQMKRQQRLGLQCIQLRVCSFGCVARSEKLVLEKCVSLVKKRLDKMLKVAAVMITVSASAFILPPYLHSFAAPEQGIISKSMTCQNVCQAHQSLRSGCAWFMLCINISWYWCGPQAELLGCAG